jgi:NAD-dependent deacetylase
MEFPAGVIQKLRAAKSIVVLTGAGISAESGVPTFRDAQTGLWANFKPEELATPQAFRRNPAMVWDWYMMRREMIKKVKPNPGHYALAEIETKVPQFLLVTQNIDDLHHLAGNRNVIEIHGNIQRTKCFDEDTVVESWDNESGVPPKCPRCGGLLRPDVVWFGEMLPPGAFERSAEAARNCDAFFSIGTSSLVYPAASLPYEAIRRKILSIEINPEETPLTGQVDHHFQGSSGMILPELVAAVWPS